MTGKMKGCVPAMVLETHTRKQSSTLARAVCLQIDLPREFGKQMETGSLSWKLTCYWVVIVQNKDPKGFTQESQWESLTPEGRTQKPGESQVLDTQCKGTVGKQEENSMPPPRFSNQLDVGRHTVWGTQLN